MPMTHEPAPAARQLVRSPTASVRIAASARWLVERGRATEVLIVGASSEAAADLARTTGISVGGTFGWHRLTLGRLAGALAGPVLGGRGLTPVGRLSLEALAAHIVHVMGERALGRFGAIADRPG